MVSDLDIYRSASVLMKQYGDRAALVAAGHAKQLDFKGDKDGAATWLRIAKATREIQRTERKPGEAEQ